MEVVYPQNWIKKVKEGLSNNLINSQINKKSKKQESLKKLKKSKNKLKILEEKIIRLQKAIVFIIEFTDFDLNLLQNKGFDLSEFNLPEGVLDPPSPQETLYPNSSTSQTSKSKQKWSKGSGPLFDLLTPKAEPLDQEDDKDESFPFLSNNEEDGQLYGGGGDEDSVGASSSSFQPHPSSSSSHIKRAGGHPIRLLGHVIGPTYTCPQCPHLQFDEEHDFDRHSLKVHGIKKKKIYVCEYCGKVDRWKGKHFNHVRTHTGEKPFRCNICGHAAKTSQYLKEHLKIHSDEKPFGCDQCQQRFRRRPEVKMHKKKAHNIDNDLIRTCPTCNAEFKDNGKLTRHIQDIHENKRTVECHLCNQPFKRKEHLEKHLERHNNPKRRKRGPQKPNPRNKPKAWPEDLKEENINTTLLRKRDEEGGGVGGQGGVPPSLICETVLGEEIEPEFPLPCSTTTTTTPTNPQRPQPSHSRSTSIQKRAAFTAKMEAEELLRILPSGLTSKVEILTNPNHLYLSPQSINLKMEESEVEANPSISSSRLYGDPPTSLEGHTPGEDDVMEDGLRVVNNLLDSTPPDDVKDFQMEYLD